MQQGLADEGILVHVRRLIVCGERGAVKATGGPSLAKPEKILDGVRFVQPFGEPFRSRIPRGRVTVALQPAPDA
jgi:hypothetical protein